MEEAKIQNSLRQGRYSGLSRFTGSYTKGVTGNFNHPGSLSANDSPLLPRPSGKKEEPKKLGWFFSTSEMDAKRAKGLCYWCDEKYGPNHQCRRRQLYKIEYVEEPEESWEDINHEEEEEETVTEGELAQVSANAMSSLKVPNFSTMSVQGSIGKKTFGILIDCGSSHNFLHPEMVKKFGLKTVQVDPVKVVVADGNTLTTTSLCPKFWWKMQGQDFEKDVLILPVGGCEVVLGMQWLSTIGDVKWNFAELKMEFVHRGNKVALRGSKQQATQLIPKKQMQKLLSKPE